MLNIGFVLYKKGDTPGTLRAQWSHSILGTGTGQATCGPVEGFAGCYHICYFDDNGNKIAERELEIQKDGDHYELAWIDNGKVTGKGIGMEVTEGLAAGWRNVYDKPPQASDTPK